MQSLYDKAVNLIPKDTPKYIINDRENTMLMNVPYIPASDTQNLKKGECITVVSIDLEFDEEWHGYSCAFIRAYIILKIIQKEDAVYYLLARSPRRLHYRASDNNRLYMGYPSDTTQDYYNTRSILKKQNDKYYILDLGCFEEMELFSKYYYETKRMFRDCDLDKIFETEILDLILGHHNFDDPDEEAIVLPGFQHKFKLYRCERSEYLVQIKKLMIGSIDV